MVSVAMLAMAVKARERRRSLMLNDMWRRRGVDRTRIV